MPARIFFITRKWAPAMGGMETYSHNLSAAMKALGSVKTLSLPGRRNGLPPRLASLLAFGIRTAVYLLTRRQPPRVVHLADMAIWPLGLAARLRFGGTRIALSAHGTDVAYHRRGGLRGRAYGLYLRLGAKLLRDAAVIANSEATRLVAVETGWRGAFVVPLATDITGPRPTGACHPYIFFAGRLVERKGCAWFIRNVLPQLPSHINLKVAGIGWDDSELHVLDDPRVEFLGSLRGQDLTDAYRYALCVIVPNIEPKSGEFEGFGLVATEAAAAGGVVVAARTGGLVQAVDAGVTGWLVTAEDTLLWVEEIARIAAWSKAERCAFLMRSMARCRDYYCWSRVARETVNAYGFSSV